MDRQVGKFIEDILNIAPFLRGPYQEIVDYWLPDIPPSTIALSELGRRIVDDIHVVDDLTRKAVFNKIESVMLEGAGELYIAVATGMVEGIASRAARIGVWAIIRPMLGERSALHAAAWMSE